MKIKHWENLEQDVNIGDRFKFEAGDSWEVVAFTGATIYGPAGLMGTPIVRCKSLDKQMPHWLEQYKNEDGTIDFCGDSVAATIAGHFEKRRASHSASGDRT